jgi:6-methylsalicylic acid synthase
LSTGLRDQEPIAIIGMGCRFPGGITSPDELWEFLIDGRDAWNHVPADRWAAYARRGGEYAAAAARAIQTGYYLDDIAGFDAEFFGVSPREAALMDPQQRMTVEVAWEALEHAGLDPTSLAGGDTAVYMGVCTDDYGRRLLEDLPRVEGWTGIGSSLCGVANRVSYLLDLRGPSVAVDTACSASLVAVHQACQSLRAGETALALAGGVMLVTSPSFALVLEAAGALSPDGRSKAFDEIADGYGRGEGCGVLVLKRLHDARRDGDRVHAVIRGSAVAQDGRTNGIMAPSQEGQENLLRRAYADAGVAPGHVDFVEAHGTGTALGDPIEIAAMAAVLGDGRPPGRPVLIGSVKTNIGHLEAASGIASIIKAVLAMRHGRIPATRTATALNSSIPWDDTNVRVTTAHTPWPETGRRPLSGVGNYGYGGTIAHVVLEGETDPPERRSPTADADALPQLYPLSAGSPAAVRANAQALSEALKAAVGPALGAVGHTLAHRRAMLSARASVVAAGPAELAERLADLGAGQTVPGVGQGTVPADGGADAVWVFSGHGSQWAGMGRELLATEPALDATLDELEDAFRTGLGFSPRQALFDDDFEAVDRAQAMIFAMQVGLARVWQSYGLRPAAVIGHSVGEIAAAVVSGMLSLSDGARLICHRSRLLRRVAGKGAMVMVNLPFEAAQQRLHGRVDVCAAIAASPTSTVLSGTAAAVADVSRELTGDALSVRTVNSDVAFHSAAVDELLDDLVDGLAGLVCHPPSVPVYSTADLDPRSTVARGPGYWADNLRRPVRFAAAVGAAAEDGHHTFLEVSAHPVVAHSIIETLAAAGVRDAVVAHTQRRGHPQRRTLLHNLGVLFCAGATVDWSALQPKQEQVAVLPTRVWQHRRHWMEPEPAVAAAPRRHDVAGHTLLGARTEVQGRVPAELWQTSLDMDSRPYPGGHAVLGVEVVPAAAILTSFIEAGGTRLHDVQLRIPVVVATPRDVQVVHQDGTVGLTSRVIGSPDGGWLTHATAYTAVAAAGHRHRDPGILTAECPETLDPGAAVALLETIGVTGIGFPWYVQELRRGPDRLAARIAATHDPLPPAKNWASLLDGALSVVPVLIPGEPRLRMPSRVRVASFHDPVPAEALVSVRLLHAVDGDAEVDVEILNTDGLVVAHLEAVLFSAVERQATTTQPEHSLQSAEVTPELDGDDLHAWLLDVIREAVAEELRADAGQLDAHRPLANMGVDSLLSAAIRVRLENRLNLALPSTLLWDWPTMAATAERIATVVTEQRAAKKSASV